MSTVKQQSTRILAAALALVQPWRGASLKVKDHTNRGAPYLSRDGRARTQM